MSGIHQEADHGDHRDEDAQDMASNSH